MKSISSQNLTYLTLITFLALILSINSQQIEKGFKWKGLQQNYCVYDEEYPRSNESLKVEVLLAILSVFDISEEKMEFSLQAILQTVWTDPNLIVNDSELMIVEALPPKIMECLWRPNVVFWNAKESNLYQDTFPNLMNEFGLKKIVSLKSRNRLKLSCNMDFHLYPLDSQHCSVIIATFTEGYPPVHLVWSDKLPDDSYVLSFNNFKPLNFKIYFNGKNSTDKAQLLHLHLLFVRSLMASIVNIYIPSFIIVTLSMVSFWLDVNAVPGRVTLGVTAILTLATSIAQARSSLPTLDYMTAMDIWLLGCMVTVFLSLIEFTLAQASCRRASNLATNQNNKQNIKRNSKTAVVPFLWTVRMPKSYRNFGPSDQQIQKDNLFDRTSRFLFPVSFLIFTITYWTYYLN